MIPPSTWHTQVSSRPEAGEHLVPGGPSAVTDLSKRPWKHSKTKLSSMTVDQKWEGLIVQPTRARPIYYKY